MKKYLILSLSLALVSCSDYLDINESPNSPTIDKITPNLALAAAQSQTYRMISGDNQNFETSIRSESANQFGNIMMNSWAGNVRNTTNPYSSEYRSIMTSSFYNSIWDYGYRNIANFQNIIDFDSNDYDNHKAIAMILKTFYMQTIVDLYGDCPYSEAFKGQDNIYPSYDDDKAIYRSLYDQLDSALALIASANSSDAVVGGEDVMLGGNMTSWIRFANSIKLRLLVRQSSLTDSDSVTYIQNKLTDLIAANNFIVSSVTLNPGYSAGNANQQNPFYGAYGYDISGNATSNRNLIVASKHAATKLNTPVDPRRAKLFTLVSGSVVGTEQGEDSSTAPVNSSLLGTAYIPTVTATGSAMSSYVMTLAEVKFLLAEMAVRYPAIMASFNAQTLFNEGIAASFSQLGNTNAEYTTYLAAIDGQAGRGWSASTNKVECILYQKWVALMHVNAHESWFDYVRTGFPVTPLALTNSGVGKPNRLLYPASEYITNSQNVPQQSSASAFNSAPFWKP